MTRERTEHERPIRAGTGRLIVISGPSGSGKTTLCSRLLERPGFERVITCTTRAPRGGERDGVDYHFLSREAFERGIREGAFLEHAEVYGNRYGTPRAAVIQAIERGASVVLNIDVQGARQLRDAGVEPMVTIFVVPPSEEELEARLRRRGTDSDDAIRRRLEESRRELAEREAYDHEIVNRDLNRAVTELLRVLELPAVES